ncbi:MAG: hypothetical protein KAQ62_20090, partial [Cyclobacteriaceae bacterium]|nr:hypothetical protein [Cyclobacteriaceae bacterium]MCK5467766.1 metal-dependent phosphohydrolase [Cyclobacteriaceae bacterium]
MDDNEYNSNRVKKTTNQGRQTLFRVTYRTQINLIRIADNKANMILGINAMIISVLIGMIGSRMIFSTESINGNLALIMPIVLIMLTSLFTALFAVRAAQPHLIKPKEAKPHENKKASLLFFENIWDLTTEDYIKKMETLLDSPQDIYQNMIIDIHNQAKVLHRKYKLLRTAYIIFMFGYIISILSFLILWLLV